MKHSLFIAFFLCLGSFASAQQLTSPDGNLSLEFMEQADGVPAYRLDYKGKPVLTSGRLGLLTEEADLTRGFKQTNLERASVDSYWNPVWGEYNRVRNHYNEMTVTVEQPETGRILNIRFRLFNDGLGFRYELPLQRKMNYLTVKDEVTEFNLTGNHKAFCIPGDYDTNEFAYTTAPLSEIAVDMEQRIAKKSYESKAEGGLTAAYRVPPTAAGRDAADRSTARAGFLLLPRAGYAHQGGPASVPGGSQSVSTSDV